jgi:hypothetical protein
MMAWWGTDAGVRPARQAFMAIGCALGLVLTACSGKGGNVTGPDEDPTPQQPGTGNDGVPPGSYVLERINGSAPGQLVSIANPDGKVIGLYRFEATTLDLDAEEAFNLELRYTDDKAQFGIDDHGAFEQAGPASQDGALPLTFTSAIYGDAFTAVVLGDFVALKYDFDGDGQMDTSLGFRRGE